MSRSREIDNEEALFQFDSYEGFTDAPGGAVEAPSILPSHAHRTRTGDVTRNLLPFASSSPDLTSHTLERTIMGERNTFESGKGKGISLPMPIRPLDTAGRDDFGSGSSSSEMRARTSFTHSSPLSATSFDVQTPLDDVYRSIMNAGQVSIFMPASSRPGSPFDDEAQTDTLSGKGKARELPPMLPPLEFSPTELGYSRTDWPSPGPNTPTPGPSSYGSGYGSVVESSIDLIMANQNVNRGLPHNPPPPIIRRMPSRRRSFSHLSIHSTRSAAALSMTRIKGKFGSAHGPGNLARKLLSGSRAGSSTTSPIQTPGATTPGGHLVDGDVMVGQGNCFMPWRNDTKKEQLPPVPFLDLDTQLAQQRLPVYGRNADFKGKSRSYSSPLPISAFDIIPAVTTDVFTPILIEVHNYFDDLLPRELRLRVLVHLIALYEEEHDKTIQEGEWTVSRASSPKSKWVGKDRGFRELVKLSRVSKSWQALVFDGQMWSNLDLRAFPKLPSSILTRLSSTAGTFIKSIDAAGHSSLLPSTLSAITKDLCLPTSPDGFLLHTQLTTIDFQGCAALTTYSLEDIITRSPSLQRAYLKGLTAVTNVTCDTLGKHCPNLSVLDIGRCLNVDGQGIKSLIQWGLDRGQVLPLKELRASGIKRVNDDTLALLGKGAPLLEVLDLSYVRDLHNSALEAFVACPEEEEEPVGYETVVLTAREAGRDPGGSGRYRRRVTRLRHLALSSCSLLTDTACSNLAHTIPRLECLELAGVGTELRDDGLIRLLSTTPFIRKLDLEDASEITDDVLSVLTPFEAPDARTKANEPPEPGHALEHLVVSYAISLTEDALLSLIRKCNRLTILEADNTRISGTVLREFVSLSRRRKIVDPIIVAIDCRGIGETLVKDLSSSTRPRRGWISYEARKLGFVDGTDKDDLKVGRNECDEKRVVLKSFYSWQTVDAVRAAREKRRKTKRANNASNGSTSDDDLYIGGRSSSRWWTPGGRRSSGTASPSVLDTNNERDQCRIM